MRGVGPLVLFLVGLPVGLFCAKADWPLQIMVAAMMLGVLAFLADRAFGTVVATPAGVRIRTPVRRRTVPWNRIDYLLVKTRTNGNTTARTLHLHRVPGHSIALPILRGAGGVSTPREQFLQEQIQQLQAACLAVSGAELPVVDPEADRRAAALLRT